MTDSVSIRWLLAWLSFFLFGIHLFSDAIKQIGSNWLKKFLSHTTSTPLKWIFSGGLVTAILQSSTVVTVMILGFVWAGLISLYNAIWAMIWASIWTTITSWIISVLWFKMDLGALALPLIAVSGFGIFIFSKFRSLKYFSLFLFGFAMLLLWLDMMGDSMSVIQKTFDMSLYLDLPYLTFIFLWMILTIILQSSSASNAITITSVSTGLIPFPIGMMMMLWSHIWTSFTSIVIGFLGTRTQKQVATVHVTFNMFSAIVGVIMIQPFFWFMVEVLGLANNDVLWLAIFHTAFNIVWAILFFPIIPLFNSLLEKIYVDKDKLYLSVMDVDENDIDTAFVAIKNDILILAKNIMEYNVSVFGVDYNKLINKNLDYEFERFYFNPDLLEKKYDKIKNMETNMVKYSMNLKYNQSDMEKLNRFSELNYSIMQFVQSCRMLRGIVPNIESVFGSDKSMIQKEAMSFAWRIWNLYIDMLNVFESSTVKEQYEIIYNSLSELKLWDRKYIFDLQEMVKSWDITLDELSDLMRVNRYLYNSSKSFILATRELFLDEKKRSLIDRQLDKTLKTNLSYMKQNEDTINI